MLRKIAPHLAIILSAMYLVFFFIDRVNSAMAFINNDITKGLLFALCLISVFNAVLLIYDDRKKTREKLNYADQRTANRRPVPEEKATAYPESRRAALRYPENRHSVSRFSDDAYAEPRRPQANRRSGNVNQRYDQ